MWLERTLDRPAELRIIASSIQVLASHHGWESWANFPHERNRLLSLVGEADTPRFAADTRGVNRPSEGRRAATGAYGLLRREFQERCGKRRTPGCSSSGIRRRSLRASAYGVELSATGRSLE